MGKKTGTNMLTDHGYVVYQRDSRSPIWEHIREYRKKDLDNFMANLPKPKSIFKQLANYTRNVAYSESEKEKRLIRKSLKIEVDETDVRTYVENFNKVLIGEQRYKEQLQQAIRAINGADEHTSWIKLAPNIAPLYTSRLQKTLAVKLNELADRYANGEQLTQNEIESNINDSILEAFEDLLENPHIRSLVHDSFGTDRSYLDLLQEIRNNIALQQGLFDKVSNRLTKIYDAVDKVIDRRKSNKKYKYGHSVAKEIAKSEQSGQLGGSVMEVIGALLQQINMGKGNGNVTSMVTSGEMAKTDAVTVFSTNLSVDTEAVAREITDVINNSDISLKNTAQQLQTVYQELELDDNTFVIFSNDKNYGFESFEHRGFQNDSARRLDSIVDLFAQDGILSNKDSFTLLDALYSSMTGAVLEDEQDRLKKEVLPVYLMAIIGNLLFDDWHNITKDAGDQSSIHALYLDGINYPLSAFLFSVARVLDDMDSYQNSDARKYVNVTVTIPSKIEYEEPPNDPRLVYQQWQDQRDEAKQRSVFSTHFLRNFREDILEKLF